MDPAAQVRVMLSIMRAEGWPFEKAWTSAIQRLRATSCTTPEEVEELRQWKWWLAWAEPTFRHHYEGRDGPPPPLDVFGTENGDPLLDAVGAPLSAAAAS